MPRAHFEKKTTPGLFFFFWDPLAQNMRESDDVHDRKGRRSINTEVL